MSLEGDVSSNVKHDSSGERYFTTKYFLIKVVLKAVSIDKKISTKESWHSTWGSWWSGRAWQWWRTTHSWQRQHDPEEDPGYGSTTANPRAVA